MVLAPGSGEDGLMKNTGFSNNELATSARPLAPTAQVKPTAAKRGTWRDEVARTAYFIYLNRGCPQGQDMQHWLAAEARMTAPAKASAEAVSR